MRCIAYIRVSTERQADDGLSLDAQRAKITAWCAATGGALDPADVFVDAGISGKRADNRPGLVAALNVVTERPGTALVVYSLSRLARSTRDTINIAERIERAGADLVSLSEKIDTTSAAGKMVFRLLAVLAEFERDLVSERTLSVVAHKRAKGERLGQIPFGQRLGPDGRTLEPDPAEAAALADVLRWSAEGLSLRKIAAALDARGERPKNGGQAWDPTSVRKLIIANRPKAAPGPL